MNEQEKLIAKGKLEALKDIMRDNKEYLNRILKNECGYNDDNKELQSINYYFMNGIYKLNLIIRDL